MGVKSVKTCTMGKFSAIQYLSVLLLPLVLQLFLHHNLILPPCPMDQLSAYSVHLTLSKIGFIHQLEHRSVPSLCDVRTKLIEVNNPNLIFAKILGLSLVNQRDCILTGHKDTR